MLTVMGLISSIINLKFVSFFFLITFLGCSSSNNSELPKKVEDKVTFIKKVKKAKVSLGPSKVVANSPFIEKTKDYGLEAFQATHLYAVDFDNDGHTDLVALPNFYSPPVFLKFTDGKFKKLSYEPFIRRVRASYLTFADFDKDGVLDLLVGTLNQKTELTKRPLRIFKGVLNKGKLLYNEIGGAFPTGVLPTASVTLLDYDLDGELDIYQGNWYNNLGARLELVSDRLLKGKGFKFQDQTVLLENERKVVEERSPNLRPTYGTSLCDINLDGYPDILTSSSSGMTNKLWVNTKLSNNDLRFFRDHGQESGYGEDSLGQFDPRGGGNSFFAICHDYNNDGIIDILSGELSHSYDPEERDRSSILTGSTFSFPPKFIRTEYHTDDGKTSWSQGDRRASWFDFNFDGFMDILLDNSGFPPDSRLTLFRQESDHAYVDEGKEYGIDILNPSGSVVLDFNQDGRMDFISGQNSLRGGELKTRSYLFENRVERKGRRSIRVYPRGTKSNSGALGALIELETNQRKMRQLVTYTSGGLPSQNEEGILFGLLKGEAPLKFKITWPILGKDKKPLKETYRLSNLKFNQFINVTVCESGRLIKGKKKACPK